MRKHNGEKNQSIHTTLKSGIQNTEKSQTKESSKQGMGNMKDLRQNMEKSAKGSSRSMKQSNTK